MLHCAGMAGEWGTQLFGAAAGLDGSGAEGYLPLAMIRQMLAFLALITGLAAVMQPAQAAPLGAGVESVGLVEQVGRVCGVLASAPSTLAVVTRSGDDDRAKICPRPVITIVVPAVMLQGDRAHE